MHQGYTRKMWEQRLFQDKYFAAMNMKSDDIRGEVFEETEVPEGICY